MNCIYLNFERTILLGDAFLNRDATYFLGLSLVPSWGHHTGDKTTRKVLQSSYYWPSPHEDAYEFVRACDICQQQGSISRHHKMSMTKILELELFDVWGTDFIGPFMSYFGNKYIFVVVHYVLKWIEAMDNNNGKKVVLFLRKNIFSSFGVPRIIIFD